MAVTGDEEKALLGEPGGRAIAAAAGRARPHGRWLEAYRGTTGWVLLSLGCREGRELVNPVTSCFPMLLFQLVMVPRNCVVMSQ